MDASIVVPRCLLVNCPDLPLDSVRAGPQLLAVECSVRVVNVVLSGRDYRLGALWVNPAASTRQVIEIWIRKLRYTSSVIGSP